MRLILRLDSGRHLLVGRVDFWLVVGEFRPRLVLGELVVDYLYSS
jgi:hypothetical protein